MPSSAVVLRLHRTEIDAELTLPIGELAMGWEKPLPLDSVQTVQEYGAGTRRICPRACPPVCSRRAALDRDGARGDPARSSRNPTCGWC